MSPHDHSLAIGLTANEPCCCSRFFIDVFALVRPGKRVVHVQFEHSQDIYNGKCNPISVMWIHWHFNVPNVADFSIKFLVCYVALYVLSDWLRKTLDITAHIIEELDWAESTWIQAQHEPIQWIQLYVYWSEWGQLAHTRHFQSSWKLA